MAEEAHPIPRQNRLSSRQGRASFACLVLVAVTGCSWFGSSRGADQEPEEFPILWEKAGSHCGLTSPAQLVLRTQAEMSLCPISDVPVDFGKEMVLVAGMGKVMYEGYAIRIHRVWREGSFVKVDVRVHRPTLSSQPTLQWCSPYHLVIVPRSDLNVEAFAAEPQRPKGAGQRTYVPTGPPTHH